LEKGAVRLYFIDNLKIALIMLVVVHHAGQAYGPGGWWYFREGETINWLGRFFAVNAAFFMSLFFFLSAYFLPASLEKKGMNRFLKERFSRIGIPLLFGFLIIIPILMYCYYINFRNYGPISFVSYYFNVFFGLGDKPEHWTGPSWPDMQFGHLWFLEHLLVYALLYSAWVKFMPQKKTNDSNSEFIQGYKVVFFLLIITMVTFVVRIWFPIDRWSAFLGFIQTEFAHVPQYISFFCLGLMAYQGKWFLNLKTSTGMIWLALGIVIAGSLYFGGDVLYPHFNKGGLNIGSLVRSFVETLLCLSLVIGLLILFREKFNRTNRLVKSLSSNVFVVYFIHVPVVVFLQYTVSELSITVLAKFLLSSILGIILSFLFSYYVWRKTPLLKNMM
jgi:glucans biosynthesis protein C